MKNYYDIYGHKDIRVNTNNKNDNENGLNIDNGQSDEPSSKVNTIKFLYFYRKNPKFFCSPRFLLLYCQ